MSQDLIFASVDLCLILLGIIFGFVASNRTAAVSGAVVAFVLSSFGILGSFAPGYSGALGPFIFITAGAGSALVFALLRKRNDRPAAAAEARGRHIAEMVVIAYVGCLTLGAVLFLVVAATTPPATRPSATPAARPSTPVARKSADNMNRRALAYAVGMVEACPGSFVFRDPMDEIRAAVLVGLDDVRADAKARTKCGDASVSSLLEPAAGPPPTSAK